MDYSKLAAKEQIIKTIEALGKNGISAELMETSDEAKAKILSLIPAGAEVLTMTSVSLDETGVTDAVNNSGKYDSVRNKLNAMNRETDTLKMQKLGAAPEWVVGSVHAVTENGEVIVVSNTGSQLPAYAYGSTHVIWVVGTQKMVKSIDDGMKRIREYIVPLESQRARKAYNMPEFNTNVSKVLIVNKEVNPKRIHIIFVNQKLGF